MNILITESPSHNGYIESLINAYSRAGHTVICDVNNFFFSGHIPEALHIHWPERLYKWTSLQCIEEIDIYKKIKERLQWYKNNGTKIIHTIHNVAPHETTNSMEEEIYQLVIEYADILVHHCDRSIDCIVAKYPKASDKNNIVCPHGDYLIHYKDVNQTLARQQYNIPENKTVILNFGRQRPYKNEDFIEKVFRNLSWPTKHLLIAGPFENPGKSYASKLYYKARNKTRTMLKHPQKQYIYKSFPTSELPSVFCSADIVFLGQTKGLNSGLLAMAATYSKLIVCPNIGCFSASLSEWQHQTYEAGNATEATKALLETCVQAEEIKKNAQALDNSNWLEKHSWDRHAGNILKAIA